MLRQLISLSIAIQLTFAARNITVDDSDTSRIVYHGNWTSNSTQDYYYGGTEHITDELGAWASLTFHGSAIYYFGISGTNLGTYTVNLDGEEIEINSPCPTCGHHGWLFDFLLFWRGRLDSGEHTIKITNTRPQPGYPYVTFMQVDRFIYTVDDEEASSTSSTGAIVGGVVGGVAVLIIALLIAFIMTRRRKKTPDEHIQIELAADEPELVPTPFSMTTSQRYPTKASRQTPPVGGNPEMDEQAVERILPNAAERIPQESTLSPPPSYVSHPH